MFLSLFLILPQIHSSEECTYQSNLISIADDVSMDDIKDPYRPTFIRLTSPGCPFSPASQAQWEKAASLYPQVNFVTVDSWKNTKITTLFGKELITPTHALFLANSTQYSDERRIGNIASIQSSPQQFLDLIQKQTNLYPIAPPLISLSPMIIDSFYKAVDDPIILLRDSRCTDQVPFLNEWSRVANEVIFSNGVNPRIGMLDCNLYPNECQRWSHPYTYTTPRALIYSSKTGNYEVLDTYDNINQEKIDGLYANALSRAPQATPSPVPIPPSDFKVPPTDGYSVLENTEFREQRTIETVRKEYKESFVRPKSACQTAEECESQTLDAPNDCPNIVPSSEDQTNALKLLNFFRGLAGLSKDVVKDDAWSQECYKTAINMHKIGKVPPDHIIQDRYADEAHCGEPNNVQVSKDSLLSENSQSVFQSVYGLFRDEGEHNNGVVGHRRFLLHPSLNKVGLGFYPYKEEKFDGFRMMRPAVTVIRVTKDNSLGYVEESVPASLKFISWPPEGPFPLEHLPSNWHISHKDFRKASLDDLRIFVARDDNAELKVKQAFLPKTVNSDTLVIQMTEEALKRCQLLRTITVTVFNDKLKKVYRFSFDLFDTNEVTEACIYNADSSKCPSSVPEENRFKAPASPELFKSSANPVNVHVVEPITLGNDKLSLTANTKFFLIGETIDGTVSIGSQTTVDIQNPAKTMFEISWSVKQKKIGKLETALTAKSINVNVEEEDETISIYDLTFYTGRQTSFGLSKSIFAGENNDLYYTIGGVNDNFYVMASSNPAYQEFSCVSDDEFEGPNIVSLWSIFDMHKQKTNKRVIKIYVSNIAKENPINYSAFIPGRKRDYQFIVVGGNIYFSCDMNISSVANSVTFSKARENIQYSFEVYTPKYNADDQRMVCPMDFITINGATHSGDSKSVVIIPKVRGDQEAINFHKLENFNDLYPAEGAADTEDISAIPSGSSKSRCIITTSGTHSRYKVTYNSENPVTKNDYDPKIFRPAEGTEDKPVTLSLYEIDNGKMPTSGNDKKMYFENYQDLTLDMPFFCNGRITLNAFRFYNCGKVTFIGNIGNVPAEQELDTTLVLGNFNFGLVLIPTNVLVTESKSYDGTWVKAKNLNVSSNLNPTITNISIVDNFAVDSSNVILDQCTFGSQIRLNMKKSQSWWPSVSLRETQFDPDMITVDLGIKDSSAKVLADAEEYESHSLVIGLDPSTCGKVKSRTFVNNKGKFSLECSSDNTELVVVKGKENAPVLSPEGGNPTKPTPKPEEPVITPKPATPVPEDPVVTPEPTPLPEIVDTIDGNGKTDEELNKDLTDKFKKLEEENPKGASAVVVIENTDNVNFNLDLNDNQFIKPQEGATVQFNGGNLNLVLPGEVKVVMPKEGESDLAIKGEGKIELDFKDGGQNPTSISLSKKSQINGTVEITVPTDVSTFSIDAVELDSKSAISVKKKDSGDSVTFTIKDVTARPSAAASLSNVVIENSLKVVQTAVLNVENVKMDKATVSYDISDFSTLAKPFITGTFSTLPGSLTLSKKTGSQTSPGANVEYPIVSGTFKDVKCEDWYPKISFGDSGFNTKVCLENGEELASSENKRIVLKFDPSDGSKGKNKLGAGAIAGIVIGCVAAVAIVVVVVVVVLKRKKERENSSDVGDVVGNENNNEV